MQDSIKERVNGILTTNGLDFEIQKEMLLGTSGRATPFFGLYNSKTNECINTVKEGYTISQNSEVVEMVLRGMEPFGGELSVQKAGSLNGGRKIFLQLGIEGTSRVGNDTIKRYVTIIDSNDGSTGLSVGIGDLTMSCQNQFFYFYKNGQAKMRHTASLEAKIKEIPSLIELALNQSIRQIGVYERFVDTSISDNDIHKMVNLHLGLSKLSSIQDTIDASSKTINAMESLYEMIRIETAQKGKNVWGLHSGVTRWTTHEKSAPKRENGRIESAMLSTNYRTNQTSFEFARELAMV